MAPTLLPNELLETFRYDAEEDGRVDVDDDVEACLPIVARDIPRADAPAILEAPRSGAGLTAGRWSAVVFRFNPFTWGGAIWLLSRALAVASGTSASLLGGGIRLGGLVGETSCTV